MGLGFVLLGLPVYFFWEARRAHGVNFDPKALRLAVDFAGASQVLAGSDYPHRIGSIALMKEVVEGAGLSAEERAAILGGNAERLLSLWRTTL